MFFKKKYEEKAKTKMRAIEAAVHILIKEGVHSAFGVPGAAINPLYAAMKKIGGSFAYFQSQHIFTLYRLGFNDKELRLA